MCIYGNVMPKCHDNKTEQKRISKKNMYIFIVFSVQQNERF